MQFGHFAFGERDDTDAGKPKALEQGGNNLLVTAKAVQGFGYHDVEAAVAGAGQQRLVGGPEGTSATERPVLKHLHQLPTFGGQPLPS